jgi:two-component system, OmpR family, KDP operon response regulator KdpE
VCILIVSADPRLLNNLAIKLWLSCPGMHIYTAEAADLAAVDQPLEQADSVILDICMREPAHRELLCELRHRYEGPIVVLDSAPGEIGEVRAFASGADDYIGQPCAIAVLLARVRAILRRGALPPAASRRPDFRWSDLEIDLASSIVTRGGRVVHLTAYEFRLLAYLVRNRDRIIPYGELEACLRGRQTETDHDQLAVFIRRLRLKLEEDPSHPRYLLNERRVGYVFMAPSRALCASQLAAASEPAPWRDIVPA